MRSKKSKAPGAPEREPIEGELVSARANMAPARGKNGQGRPTLCTAANAQLFLRHLAHARYISIARRRLGISESTLRRWRKNDPQFDAEIKRVYADATEDMEAALAERGFEGMARYVLHNGQPVRDPQNPLRPLVEREFDTKAAHIVLQARDRVRYSTRADMTLRPGMPDFTRLPTDGIGEEEAADAYAAMRGERE